jgi:hypothetical protein
MIYLKSLLFGAAVVLASLFAIGFIFGIVVTVRGIFRGDQNDIAVGYFVSVRSPVFWVPVLVIFIPAFFFAYRRFASELQK